MLIHKSLGSRVHVTGGDTDSLKISCDPDVVPGDILEALKPLHDATKAAIDHVQARVRNGFPDLASKLDHIGEFEIENDVAYPWHLEGWNKARASFDSKGECHITLAGVSRPRGSYTVETWATDRVKQGYDERDILPVIIGYNTYIRNDTSHALEHRRPKTTDIYDKDVIDYLGNKHHVCAHQSIALYPVGRMIGDTDKHDNAENVEYMRKVYGRNVNVHDKIVGRYEESVYAS